MNKTELIEAVVKATGLSKKDATAAVKAVFDSISGAMKKGKKVSLIGFGTFYVTKVKARKARNPQTGADIKVPAHKAPKFKAGKGLKDLVK